MALDYQPTASGFSSAEFRQVGKGRAALAFARL
jgi:hypothetical protein